MAGRYESGRDWLHVPAVLAEIERLQANRSYRDTHNVFYVEGARNVIQALDNDYHPCVVLYSERLLTVPLVRRKVRELRRAAVPVVAVSPEEFRRVSRTGRASGVGMVIRQKWGNLHVTKPRSGLFWIVLENVRSKGNLGTLIRTSEAVGGAGFILLGRAVDPFAPETVRASMGATFGQRFIRVGSDSLQHWIQRHKCQAIGASPEGAVDFQRFRFPRAALLFLGEERQGLSVRQRGLCNHLVRIPMTGAADSLNVGVAGSLLMYEVFRAQQGRGGG